MSIKTHRSAFIGCIKTPDVMLYADTVPARAANAFVLVLRVRDDFLLPFEISFIYWLLFGMIFFTLPRPTVPTAILPLPLRFDQKLAEQPNFQSI